MFTLFRVLADRLKALFVADVGLDFEAQFAARDAERKAALLRQAACYQNEGLTEVASELRQHAEAISYQRPLDSILPALTHWHGADMPAALPPGKASEPIPGGPGEAPVSLSSVRPKIRRRRP